MGFTEAQARKLCEQAGAPLPAGMHAGNFEHVRNTKRKIVDGIGFRSTLEANTYQLLKSWQAAAAIRNLVLQPRFLLQPKFRRDGKTIRAMMYTPDFQYEESNRTVVIEAKGHKTQPYRMRRKMFLMKYPEIDFQEWDRETLKRNSDG
jgi:hypothetical protein